MTGAGQGADDSASKGAHVDHDFLAVYEALRKDLTAAETAAKQHATRAAILLAERDALIERCAVVAWRTGMNTRIQDPREVGALCAAAIRELAALSPASGGAEAAAALPSQDFAPQNRVANLNKACSEALQDIWWVCESRMRPEQKVTEIRKIAANQDLE